MTECQYSSETLALTQSLPTPLISVTTPTVLTVTVIRCLGLVLIWWLLLLLLWLLVELRLALTLHIRRRPGCCHTTGLRVPLLLWRAIRWAIRGAALIRLSVLHHLGFLLSPLHDGMLHHLTAHPFPNLFLLSLASLDRAH